MKMNYRNLIGIFFIILFSSCIDDIERANEDIQGVWKLESMQYEDSTGNVKVITDSDIKLIFTNDNKEEGDDSGFQIIDTDTISFIYFVGPDYNNFRLERSDIRKLPLPAIGKTQLYDFNKIDKKTIEFYTDSEYCYLDNQKIYNTSYLYSKISN
jgi:hypothetical protein